MMKQSGILFTVKKRFLLLIVIFILSVNTAFAYERGQRVQLEEKPIIDFLTKYYAIGINAVKNANGYYDNQSINEMKKLLEYCIDEDAEIQIATIKQSVDYYRKNTNQDELNMIKNIRITKINYHDERGYYEISYNYFKEKIKESKSGTYNMKRLSFTKDDKGNLKWLISGF